MSINVFKGLTLACVLAVMAGCSSTSSTDGGANNDSAATTDTTADSSMSSGMNDTTEPTVQLETVFYFDFDEATLSPSVREALMNQADALKDSYGSVRLEGHADERGTREYNMALGEKRANVVRDFLVLQGVDASRIETVSYGEERPARTASNESAWAENRRVELK